MLKIILDLTYYAENYAQKYMSSMYFGRVFYSIRLIMELDLTALFE